MVVDLNFHKVKKLFFVIIFFIFFSTNLFAQNLKFKKLVVLNDPWGSSFLDNKELIITEKSGKIKIINILQKKAVEGLTVSLAAEFAPNIRVNCVAPSLTKSKIAEPMLKNTAIAEGIAKAHPLKRLGEGKDSAALAKFLLTEDSSWVTGQIIAVDGGRSKLS